jgi:hypothetical protein
MKPLTIVINDNSYIHNNKVVGIIGYQIVIQDIENNITKTFDKANGFLSKNITDDII